MPDNTLSTLQQIQTKVRRLTRSPSESQLSTDDLNDYINTFVLYDFPEQLRLFNLKTTLTFYTSPNIDVYETTTTNVDDPLYNFKNRYITVHPPVFIGGFQTFYTQDRSQFFSMWPFINQVQQIALGGNGVVDFAGTLTGFPVFQNQVIFDSIDVNNNSITLIDDPQTSILGNLIIPNDVGTGAAYGTINYVTGAYTIHFPVAPANGQAINAQTVLYQANRPQSMLFFDGKFTLRPVPDQAYRVQMEVNVRPTEFLNDAQQPELAEWFQYIAYGTAKKIFEDRQDMDSVGMIMPEFKQQERLILRRTLVQNSNQRTATIYSTGGTNNWFGGGFGWYFN